MRRTQLTRRHVLKGALEAGGVLAAGSLATGSLVGVKPATQATALADAKDADTRVGVAAAAGESRQILDFAATVEALTMTFYGHVFANATFFMEAEEAGHLRRLLDAEANQLEVWLRRGGVPQTDVFQLPLRLLSDARTFVHTGLLLEAMSAGVYLAATRQFAQMGQPALAATAAQHAASEAQHHTLLARLAGFSLEDVAQWPPFEQAIDAAPLLKAFLEGEADATYAVTLPRME